MKNCLSLLYYCVQIRNAYTIPTKENRGGVTSLHYSEDFAANKTFKMQPRIQVASFWWIYGMPAPLLTKARKKDVHAYVSARTYHRQRTGYPSTREAPARSRSTLWILGRDDLGMWAHLGQRWYRPDLHGTVVTWRFQLSCIDVNAGTSCGI